MGASIFKKGERRNMFGKKIVTALALGLMMILAVSAYASDPVQVKKQSTLTGTLGNVTVDATATLTNGVWDYVYVVSPLNMPSLFGQLHSFSIGNPGMYAYYAVASSDTTYTWDSSLLDTVRWEHGHPSGNTATFSFKSIYSPTVVDCSAQNSGHASTGETLGMVPEPMSMLSLTFGLGSIAWLKRTRRK